MKAMCVDNVLLDTKRTSYTKEVHLNQVLIAKKLRK